jgi:hypothetical protein
MDKENKQGIIITASILLLLCVIVVGLIFYTNQYTEYEYQLYEMSEGVYVIYYNTYSSIPAYNYEVVTVCSGSGVHTFKGDVTISFTDDEPYVKVRTYDVVNSDEIYVYVPKGTISYQPGVNITQ